MIFFDRKIYLGENAGPRKKNIINNIKKHRFQAGIYVISLCTNGTDIFDIIPTWMISKEGYNGKDINILGIAYGKDEAIDVVCRMILDVYEKTGNMDVRGYFS